MKTSIIVVAFDTIRLQRKITSACLANIQRYTNRDEYELIFIDQAKGKPLSLDNRHHLLDIDKHIIVGDIGVSRAFNLGYKESNPDYPLIAFIHNDVLVPDDWLKNLREALSEHKIVMPHQGPTTREFVIESRTKNIQANDDAGLVLMSKETFMQTGGWDERFNGIYQEQAFWWRFPEKQFNVSKCIITHIGCGTAYVDETREQRQYTEEGPIVNALRNDPVALKKNYL